MPTEPQSVEEDLATGDAYATRGKPPFISDLYGYAFAAAEAGITHVQHQGLMVYAGSRPDPTLPSPALLHYGLFCSVKAPGLPRPYAFNKLSYAHSHAGGFDPHLCRHFLPAPPSPRLIASAVQGREELGPAAMMKVPSLVARMEDSQVRACS